MIKKTFNIILPIIVFILCVFVVPHLIALSHVSGVSMQPTLVNGEKVLIERQAKVKRGDVIVFDAAKEDPASKSLGQNNTYYVKRVIAVGGDTVANTPNGLFVNGKRVNEDYISKAQAGDNTGYWTLNSLSRIKRNPQSTSYWADPIVNDNKVPQNQVFVLGDNRIVSEDSRYFGFVSTKHIVGVVRTLPFNTTGKPKSVDGAIAQQYFAER